jgi:membrane fusion protein (multidrug efflux system)
MGRGTGVLGPPGGRGFATLGIAVALGLAAALTVTAGAATADTTTTLVKTRPLAVHELTRSVTAYGRVQPDPDEITAITLPRAGIIQHLWISFGERVKTGQRLLQVVTAPQEQMQFEQAQAAVKFAADKLGTQKHLFKQQLTTREQVANARQKLRDARASLDALRRRGSGQRTQIVRAPVAGTVIRVNVNQGDRVKADTGALLLSTGQAVIVPLGVEPEDARRIRAGMPVTLKSAFDANLHVPAAVGSVHGMVNPKTRLLDVIVPIPDQSSSRFVLGSMVEGSIELQRAKVLAVPRRAVLSDRQGSYVFTVAQGHARRIDVSTGLTARGLVQVSSPKLRAGEPIVVLGNYGLADGMAVREAAQ